MHDRAPTGRVPRARAHFLTLLQDGLSQGRVNLRLARLLDGGQGSAPEEARGEHISNPERRERADGFEACRPGRRGEPVPRRRRDREGRRLESRG